MSWVEHGIGGAWTLSNWVKSKVSSFCHDDMGTCHSNCSDRIRGENSIQMKSVALVSRAMIVSRAIKPIKATKESESSISDSSHPIIECNSLSRTTLIQSRYD
jgi:hypothetical protein